MTRPRTAVEAGHRNRCPGCAGCIEPPLRPRRLEPGDTIMVCTPSSPGAPIAPDRFERAVGALRTAGYRVQVGDQAWSSGTGPRSARARAEEINEAARTPHVRAVLTAIGGYTANGLLPHLDLDAWRRDPKILVGYSDITALLLGIYATTNTVTFHGPTLMPELGEFPVPFDYTWQGLERAVTRPGPLGPLRPPGWRTEEFLAWDVDDLHRPRHRSEHPGWRWLVPGSGSGRLVGGNLDTMCALAGTPYLPCLDGAVLLWETCCDNLAVVERSLNQLDGAGATAHLAGMVVGASFRAGPTFEAELQSTVRERYADHGFPVLAGVDVGHADPMLTLPVGARVRLDCAAGLFEVVDGAVR